MTYTFTVTGTEHTVCRDIEARQKMGVEKYGMTVATNPAHLTEWLQHAYEESLDKAIYLKRAIAEITESEKPKPSYEGLGVWQIHTIRWEDDDQQKGKDWITTIVCKDIDAVWQWIETDRQDTRCEIRAIHHLGHACAVIPQNV